MLAIDSNGALFLQGPRDVQLENVTPKPPVIVAKGTVIPVELLNRLSTKNMQGRR